MNTVEIRLIFWLSIFWIKAGLSEASKVTSKLAIKQKRSHSSSQSSSWNVTTTRSFPFLGRD